jgi:hypothetical protein
MHMHVRLTRCTISETWDVRWFGHLPRLFPLVGSGSGHGGSGSRDRSGRRSGRCVTGNGFASGDVVIALVAVIAMVAMVVELEMIRRERWDYDAGDGFELRCREASRTYGCFTLSQADGITDSRTSDLGGWQTKLLW